MIERRIVRSSEPKTALYLYLVSVAQKLGLRALALASREGLLVTGTRGAEAIDLDTFAALGPAISGEEDVSPSFIGRALPAGPVDAARFEVQGEPFYLAGVGGTLPRIREVKAAIARILS